MIDAIKDYIIEQIENCNDYDLLESLWLMFLALEDREYNASKLKEVFKNDES